MVYGLWFVSLSWAGKLCSHPSFPISHRNMQFYPFFQCPVKGTVHTARWLDWEWQIRLTPWGPTSRLTEEVKVSKLLPQWMGLDKIVYYSATTTNGCQHLYQIWTKNYIISGTRRLTKEVNMSKQLYCTYSTYCIVS